MSNKIVAQGRCLVRQVDPKRFCRLGRGVAELLSWQGVVDLGGYRFAVIPLSFALQPNAFEDVQAGLIRGKALSLPGCAP